MLTPISAFRVVVNNNNNNNDNNNYKNKDIHKDIKFSIHKLTPKLFTQSRKELETRVLTLKKKEKNPNYLYCSGMF